MSQDSFDQNLSHISIEQSFNEDENLSQMDIVPWFSQETSQIKNPNMRFHNEIIDFFDYIIPKKKQHNFRRKALLRVIEKLQSIFPEGKVLPYGSFVTELYLPNGDIDLVIIDEKQDANDMLKQTKQLMEENPDVFNDLRVIKNAKIPIIKFSEKNSEVEFDLSFNNDDGIIQTNIVMKADEKYPELKYLFMVLKVFLYQRNLYETFKGGIGSFLLFNMILAFLRDFKKQQLNKNDVESLKDITLSEYLMKLLTFYGNFDYKKLGISMDQQKGIIKLDEVSQRFNLFSPIDESNIGNQSFMTKEVFYIFKNRYNYMTNHSFEQGESILKELINPSNKKFSDYLR